MSDLSQSNDEQPTDGTSNNNVENEKHEEQAEDNGSESSSSEIFIRGYEKRGEGINAYYVYKIETKVSNIPGYTKSHFDVWRRFSDFLGLREKLVAKYQHKGIIVPLAPEKSISALTKTKLNTTNGEESSTSDVADKRSRQLERFVRRIACHQRLMTDCDVRDFLSFDGPLPKASFTSSLSGSSMKKMFKSFGDVLSKLAFPMDENDRWFEQANSQVEELDEMLIRLNNAIDNLVAVRRELSSSDDLLSKALSMLASCEENTALARTLSKLAETHENLAIAERHEAEQDSQQLAEPIQEQLQLTSVLKEVFYERVKSWQIWQSQQQNLTKKREIKTRLDLAGKSEKAAQYSEEVKECENKADQMEKDFLTMSRVIREEYNRYCKNRCQDIKAALVSYLESLIESEEKVLEYWERLAPEAKGIITG